MISGWKSLDAISGFVPAAQVSAGTATNYRRDYQFFIRASEASIHYLFYVKEIWDTLYKRVGHTSGRERERAGSMLELQRGDHRQPTARWRVKEQKTRSHYIVYRVIGDIYEQWNLTYNIPRLIRR